MLQHPDITSAHRTGYATFQSEENRDCPEARKRYIDECSLDVLKWLRENHPDLLNDFIQDNYQDYSEWLN